MSFISLFSVPNIIYEINWVMDTFTDQPNVVSGKQIFQRLLSASEIWAALQRCLPSAVLKLGHLPPGKNYLSFKFSFFLCAVCANIIFTYLDHMCFAATMIISYHSLHSKKEANKVRLKINANKVKVLRMTRHIKPPICVNSQNNAEGVQASPEVSKEVGSTNLVGAQDNYPWTMWSVNSNCSPKMADESISSRALDAEQ